VKTPLQPHHNTVKAPLNRGNAYAAHHISHNSLNANGLQDMPFYDAIRAVLGPETGRFATQYHPYRWGARQTAHRGKPGWAATACGQRIAQQPAQQWTATAGIPYERRNLKAVNGPRGAKSSKRKLNAPAHEPI